MILMLRLQTWLMLSLITCILSLYLEGSPLPHLIRLEPKTRYRGGGIRRGVSQSRTPTLCCPRRHGILRKMHSPRRVKQFLWLVVKRQVLTNAERYHRGLAAWSSILPSDAIVSFFECLLERWVLSNISNAASLNLINYEWET